MGVLADPGWFEMKHALVIICDLAGVVGGVGADIVGGGHDVVRVAVEARGQAARSELRPGNRCQNDSGYQSITRFFTSKQIY